MIYKEIELLKIEIGCGKPGLSLRSAFGQFCRFFIITDLQFRSLIFFWVIGSLPFGKLKVGISKVTSFVILCG